MLQDQRKIKIEILEHFGLLIENDQKDKRKLVLLTGKIH